jgi:hypothetical protein
MLGVTALSFYTGSEREKKICQFGVLVTLIVNKFLKKYCFIFNFLSAATIKQNHPINEVKGEGLIS